MKVLPDNKGHFGVYGGRYVSETLMPAILKLEKAYEKYKDDPEFLEELSYYLREYTGRPTPLYYAERLSEKLGGAKVYLKREDLLHTGAHRLPGIVPDSLRRTPGRSARASRSCDQGYAAQPSRRTR